MITFGTCCSGVWAQLANVRADIPCWSNSLHHTATPDMVEEITLTGSRKTLVEIQFAEFCVTSLVRKEVGVQSMHLYTWWAHSQTKKVPGFAVEQNMHHFMYAYIPIPCLWLLVPTRQCNKLMSWWLCALLQHAMQSNLTSWPGTQIKGQCVANTVVLCGLSLGASTILSKHTQSLKIYICCHGCWWTTPA